MELPTKRSEVKDYNPQLIILYGKPKSGKSSLAASLDSNLIIDLENGYRSLSAMVVQARTARDIFEIANAIQAKITENNGQFPYRFITIDNATRLEEMSLSYAASLYRATPMGTNWQMVKNPKTGLLEPNPKADVRTLPNGSGYLYMRLAIKKMIDIFKPLCETLILICHVKDKQIRKDAQEISELSLDLAGKTGDIISGEADAIGLVYRNENKTYISFEGGDNTLKEARPLHLRGKKFVVAESDKDNNLNIDMSAIFV